MTVGVVRQRQSHAMLSGRNILIGFWLVLIASALTAECTTHVGIELSELAQNGFRDIGRNGTFFVGQERWTFLWGHVGYRVLGIGADLSSEHLAGNPFIVTRETLQGRLELVATSVDWYPVVATGRWLNFSMALGVGSGYLRTEIRGAETYDFRAVTIGVFVRCRYTFLRYCFIEFPVVSGSFYLWKNRPAGASFPETQIQYPEWGVVFFWVTVGTSFPAQEQKRSLSNQIHCVP